MHRSPRKDDSSAARQNMRSPPGVTLPRLAGAAMPEAATKGSYVHIMDSTGQQSPIHGSVIGSGTTPGQSQVTNGKLLACGSPTMPQASRSRQTLKPLTSSSSDPAKLLMAELDRFSQQVEGARPQQDQAAAAEQVLRAEHKRQEPLLRQSREARRRRLLAGMPDAVLAEAQQQQLQALGKVLSQPSIEEQRVTARLQQLHQEHACILENLRLRQAQCKQQQQADVQEQQRRQDDMRRLLEQQYQGKLAAEWARWQGVRSAQQAQQQEQVQQECSAALQDMVQLAAVVGQHGGLVDHKLLAQLRAQLHTSFAAGVPASDAFPPEDCDALRAALLDSYLHCSADWAAEDGSQGMGSTQLAEVLLHTYALAAQKAAGAPGALPDLSQVALRLAVVGPPQAGKSKVAQHLAGLMGLPLLCPHALADKLLQQEGEELLEQGLQQSQSQRQEQEQEASAGEQQQGQAQDAGVTTAAQKTTQLRDRVAAAVEAGGQLPDKLLVDVLMWGIEHEPAPPSPAVASSTAVMQRAAKHVASCRRPGFILDGFPASAAQAWLLHQRLTGCDLAQQQQLLNHGSPLLPELPDKRVSKAEPFHAGLDAVLHLDLQDEPIAIKRAVDQWLEVAHEQQADAAATAAATAASTGTQTAQQSQLDMAAEQAKRRQQQQAASLHTQVVLQLKRHCGEWPQLCALLPHLSTLVHEVAGGQELQQVLQAAAGAAAASLWAKAAHESKAAADAASLRAVKAASRAQLLVQLASSQVELRLAQVQAALDEAEAATKKAPGGKKGATPAPAPKAAATGSKAAAAAAAEAEAAAAAAAASAQEQERAAAKARVLEHLQLCKNAAAQVEQHAEQAQEAASSAASAAQQALAYAASVPGTAGTAEQAETAAISSRERTLAAIDSVVVAERGLGHARHAGDTAIGKVTQFLTLYQLSPRQQALPLAQLMAQEEQQLEQQQAEAQAAAQPLTALVADDLSASWKAVEGAYCQAVASSVSTLHQARLHTLHHLSSSLQRYATFLQRPDAAKQQLVDQLLQRFNALEPDLRSSKDAAGRLMALAEELCEALWALCDQRHDASEAERRKAALDACIVECENMVAQGITALVQAEVDRLLGCASFVELHLVAKHRLSEVPGRAWRPAEPLQVGQPASSWPAEVRELYEGKAALPLPEWAAALESKMPQLVACMKAALGVQQVVARSLVAPEEVLPLEAAKAASKPVASKAPGSKGRAGSKEPETKALAPRPAANTEQEELLRPEVERLLARLQLLAHRAVASYEELVTAGAGASNRLAELASQQHQGECSAVAALEAYLKKAAYDGELAGRVQLAGTVLRVDAQELGQRQGKQRPQEQESRPARGPAGSLQVEQLQWLLAAFQEVAPSGVVSCSVAAELLCRSASEGRLPPQWRPLSASQVQAALRAFDPTDSQYLAWHQLLLCLLVAGYPAVVSGSSWQLTRALEHLAAEDDDADGCVTQVQWSGAQLWFACADEGEEGDAAGTAEPQAVKALLWSLLAGYRQTPAVAARSTNGAGSASSSSSSTPRGPAAAGVPLVDIRAAMQVFCMGRDVQVAAARLAAVQQASPAAAVFSSAAAGGTGLPQLWMQWHDVYIAASHQELGAEAGLAALAGQP